ncbi:MAG: alpha/beta hydrolase [Candidatus Eisenbacteria bacterium]|uniref:Alpha/beta hydrolase n=1 Tax=Eiseniibacteriota bacterium TaxID=2212470 RepID=A0A538SZR9_UNCEI|nr:MAG: alpha/beta hydrolase [Candidatus Eisenbacteria bacterium]
MPPNAAATPRPKGPGIGTEGLRPYKKTVSSSLAALDCFSYFHLLPNLNDWMTLAGKGFGPRRGPHFTAGASGLPRHVAVRYRPALMRALLLLAALLSAPAVHAARITPGLEPGAHRVTVAGSGIAYHVAGSGPVVFVHPGGPGIEWTFVRMPRLEKFATVVYIEPIGTGASDRLSDPHGYTFERYVGDVEGIRAHLGIEKFVLLGHSHGGFVAQAYALAHPEHLRGLILFDTSPTTGIEWQKDVASNLEWFRNEPWFQEATDALAHETSAKTDEEITAIFKREMPLYFAEWSRRAKEYAPYRSSVRLTIAPSKTSSDSTAPEQVGVASVFEVRDRLHSISTPTLVIVGKRDFVTSEKFGRMLHEGIQGSRLLLLQHSGHMGHLEEPEAFSQGIHDFLKTLPPQVPR